MGFKRLPEWLGPEGKAKYKALCQDFSNPTEAQKDLLCLCADAFETYVSAAKELNKHMETTGTTTTTGGNGQLMPHPAFKLQQQAQAQYVNAYRQLRLAGMTGGDISESKLDDILGV